MYPERQRQLSLDQSLEQGAAIPQIAAVVPAQASQVVGGAPALVKPTVPTSLSGAGLLKNVDLNRRITPVVGSGGPERWDTPRRDSFQGDNVRFGSTLVANPVTVDQVMTQRPQAVTALRDKLEARRKTVSPQELARSPFWQEYQAKGQAFAAQLIADIQGFLSRQQRFEQADNLRELSSTQAEWVRNHPVGVWLDWI